MLLRFFHKVNWKTFQATSGFCHVLLLRQSVVTNLARRRIRWPRNFSVSGKRFPILQVRMAPVILCQSMTLSASLLAAGDSTLSFDYLSTRRRLEIGWQRVFAWRVTAPKFAGWRVIKPKWSAWRGTGHHKLMRDFLFYKCVTRDLQDLLIRFPW